MNIPENSQPSKYWFTEELTLPDETAQDMIEKSLENLAARQDLAQVLDIPLDALEKGGMRAAQDAVRLQLECTVRWLTPRCRQLDAEERKAWMVSANEFAYLIRLGVEFDLSKIKADRWRFVSSWQRLWLTTQGGEAPRVVWVYPQRLYDGEPRKVNFKAGLKAASGGVEFGGIEAGTDLNWGQVAPVMLGFHGEKERAPYWEIRSGPKAIEGTYNFWFAVKAPQPPITMRALTEVDLQIYYGSIPLSPKGRGWENRPRFEIPGECKK